MTASPTSPPVSRPSGGTAPIPWFILFFDLVIVASFSQVSHVYGDNPTWGNFGYVAACVLFLFALWGITTMELLLGDTWPRRALALLQITSLLVAALALGEGEGLESAWGFAALSVAVGTSAILMGLRARASTHLRHLRTLSLWLAVSSAVFLATALLPSQILASVPNLGEWIFFGSTLILVTVSAIHLPEVIVGRTPVQRHAVEERLGLILLIVLGESFLLLLGSVGSNASISHPLFLVGTIAVVFAVWLLYFPRLAHAPLPSSRGGVRARLTAHYVVILGCLDAIVACASIAKDPVQDGVAGGIGDSWTALPLVGILLAIGWMVLLRDRRWSVEATLLALAAVAIATLTAWGMLVSTAVATTLLLIAVAIFLGTAIAAVALGSRQ